MDIWYSMIFSTREQLLKIIRETEWRITLGLQFYQMDEMDIK